ncbi:FAD/NAD(P)-binding protein [Streptomyces sasae]|uniref:FAD/NAD(P)-binding protein n=1 Tax=Streptomyces sasae TaxID=1266772 RepID=UPI00293049A3|nr:FAD/NAD(P)-binding protein [Streptomyces sasae]
MSRGISIGVVGGGAAAVCLVDALARADGLPGELVVFEPTPHVWRGRAYQVDTEILRVNATPEDMSVREGDGAHFRRWLATRAGASTTGQDADFRSAAYFPARSLYGAYLEDSARAGLGELRRRGWRVSVLGETVTAARRMPHQVLLSTGHGRKRCFDHVVLAVGAGGPQDVCGLRGAPGFLAEPYPLSTTLRTLADDDHVVVIGSGLTCVDIVLAIAARGHRGPVSVVSRAGVLPAVRQRPRSLDLRHLTPQRLMAVAAASGGLTVDDVWGVARAEFREAGAAVHTVVDEIAGVRRDSAVDRLRRHLGAVDSPDLALRLLQHAIPSAGPTLWSLLREEEKGRILRRHRRTVMSLCCPMPPSSAAVLLALAESGQLEVLAGLRGIRSRAAGGFEVEIAGRARFGADKVVNATSASPECFAADARPLMSSLIRDRAVGRHPHGGLQLEPGSGRLVHDGIADRRLYALGSVAAGAQFFTFGIPVLVDQSRRIVAALQEPARRAAPPRSGPVPRHGAGPLPVAR